MKTETILLTFFLIAQIMKYFTIPWGGLLNVIVLSCFAIVYFPFSFYFFSEGKLKNQNLPLSIISGFFISIIPIGIMFKTQHWDNNPFLIFSLIFSFVFLIITIILAKNDKDSIIGYYKKMKIRLFTLLIVSLFFYLF